jgi:hypothetical protein
MFVEYMMLAELTDNYPAYLYQESPRPPLPKWTIWSGLTCQKQIVQFLETISFKKTFDFPTKPHLEVLPIVVIPRPV